MPKQLEKSYDPKLAEQRLYDGWEKKGYFHAKPTAGKTPYTIMMPPPNITGQLHMGHALDNTLQDILIRYRRMQGYEALWMPGTDHASIATEAKVVEAMRKDGLTKEMLGRDGFLERAWAWRKEYGGRIVRQLRTIGSSCDWERERFTMDEGCSKAVKEVFVRLYEQGLIYRGNRMVNWCPKCNTSISDAEVEYEEKAGHFWHLLYPVKETGEKLELATTRPETMLGDTAVAINGDDPRYAHLHGCHVVLPLLNKEIPIVCDEHADMEKGTGVVKITPAHDPNDFEVGKRHNLPTVRVFTYDGHMTGEKERAEAMALVEAGLAAVDEPEVLDCGKYAGMTAMEARKAILADLTEGGYLKETEDLKHDVGTCYRCHSVIEPMVSKQWFVKMEPLAGPAIEAVEKGDITFVPERFTKNYLNWMRGTRDWCISRQLWWGHQIPAWYCDTCGETVVSKDEPTVCPKCGGHLTQDPDTLDTWFSSALWPFSTLGWPEETEELAYFYPTDTLVTGYDTIGFWVSRMIFSGLAYTGKVPFKTVLIHGLVRDEQGRKMSKSLGNGIDPIEVINEYGADALRFMLVSGNSPGNDMRYSSDKVKASANFANKIWNATRYVLMSLPEGFAVTGGLPETLAAEDKWILSTFNRTVKEVTDNLDRFELGVALSKIYDFAWDCFCDWYIELSKPRISAGETDVCRVLTYVLTGILKLLHPFMPFVTEELWQNITDDGSSVMVSAWPTYDDALSFPEEEKATARLMEAISAIRSRRAEMNVPPSRKARLLIETPFTAEFAAAEPFFLRMAFASAVEVGDRLSAPADAVTLVTEGAKMYIPLDELVDKEKEKARLLKEKENLEGEIARTNGKLNNENFVSRAPAQVVDAERTKLAAAKEKLQKVTEELEKLGCNG